MIKERLEKLKHLEHKEVYLLVGFIILALVLILVKNIIKNTYAYYDYESGWVPIFTGKVGNFAKQDIEEYLASQSNSGLETVTNMNARGDTLRRYQGSSVNNYICFGTTNVSDCTKNTDKYMYRIIGIDTTTKELKIQKKDAFNHGNWHSVNGDYKWNQSQLYADLNGSLFLNNANYVPIGWQKYIVSHDWKYGDLNVTSTQTGKDVLSSEKSSLTSSVNAKVGLMYISDYYLGVSNVGKCYQASDSCKTKNWMWLWSNDTNSPVKEYEWFIQRQASNAAWFVQPGDSIEKSSGLIWPTLDIGIRPVMYISSDIKLSGTGTKDNPFIINYTLYKRPGATTGDTTPLTGKTSDINLIYYLQDAVNSNNYTITENAPTGGYTVNKIKSNCIPQNGSVVEYRDYDINNNGTVFILVSENKPSQVVCRIYYDHQ